MSGLRAVDPRVGIRALIRRRETESELLAATAEEMAPAYEAVLPREEPARPVEVVSGEGADAPTATEDPDVLTHAWKMVELGEQARVLPSVPVKMLLVDGRRAMLPLTASETGGYRAVVVRHSAVTEALQKLFDLAWQQATPLGPAGRKR